MIIGLDGNEANVKNRVGSGVYAFELLKQFSKNSTHKFQVFLKEKPLNHLPVESKNFEYKVFGPKKLWTQFALPLRLSLKPDLDIFFSLGHYGPRFSQVPYIITVHDLSYLHFPDLFKKEDLYQLKNWTKYSIEKSTHIIAVSTTTKDDIIKNYGVNPSKISVTYEGFDEKRFKSQNKKDIEKVKNKYKINGDYIIFVGTLQPRKNIERLIEAFAKIKNHKLVIAGKKGWLYEPIFEKVKKLRLEDQVVFTDYVSDRDLPVLIGGAKVYVLPSLWEGFGIPVIEAQACGTPVVAANSSSLPEIIENSAIQVDPNSTDSIAKEIKRILASPKLASSLKEKGLKNIKRFSWRKCSQETLKVLERIDTL